MRALALSMALACGGCHPYVEVAYAGEPPADGGQVSCGPETPEAVLARIAGELEQVIARYSGYPPGYETNVRWAFQDILDELHANIPNVRP